MQVPADEIEPNLKRPKVEDSSSPLTVTSTIISASGDDKFDACVKVEDSERNLSAAPTNGELNFSSVKIEPQSCIDGHEDPDMAEAKGSCEDNCSMGKMNTLKSLPENCVLMNLVKVTRHSWLKNCEFLQDSVIRFLCVLSLDRFGDYVSDQVVAPIRETCAQALGAVLKCMHSSLIHETLNILLQMQCRPEWEVRHGSLLGIKYLVAVRQVHNSESDIDALCVGPCFATLAEDFFVVLHNMLTSRLEVSEVHCVTDAEVPLMRFKLDGISIDLPYAQLKVMSVPENVDILNLFFLSDIDETSWRSLSGVHANKCILRLLPNMEVFKSLLRCVKLWAKRRGVYGNLLGFFGGVHLAILAAFICQRHPNVSLNGLISNFFKTFAFWDWRTPVILQDGMLPTTIGASEIRSLMPIRLPCRPHEYCHSNITKSTFYRIRTEFHRGHALTKDLLRPEFGWACLFEPFPYTKKYTRFVKICLAASDQDELGKWVGWVKSRFRSLLVKLEELQSFCDPNPTEYVDVNVTEPNIVFYWGLGRNGFLDLRSVKEYFVQSIRAGYQGRTGKMKLSVVQASQLPKNAQFDN